MEDMVQLDNIEQMAGAVLQWHENMLDRIQHYIEIPTGGTLQIEEVKYALEGDFLDGFTSAMKVIYTEMANNPPVVETSDEAPH